MDQRSALLRHRFLIVLTGVLIAVLLVAMVNNIAVGEYGAAWAEAMCALVLGAGWTMYLRGQARQALPILILLVDMAVVHLLYLTLPETSLAGAYSLSVMVPLVTGYFFSARRSLIWSGVFAISLVAHVFIFHSVWILSALTWPDLVRILVVYFIVVYITLGDRWMTEVFTTSVQQEVQTQTQLASELRQEVEAVKEAERAKSLFVSLASHQLRSPLTALRWSLESLANEKSTQMDEPERRIVRSAHHSTKRLIHLVTELLNTSRIESGRLRVVPTPTDLIKLVHDAMTDVQALADAKKITLKADLPANNLTLSIDPVLISQVVINFLANAIKYSPTHQTVQLRVTVEPDVVRCEVVDHGIGVPKADQTKVFQQMYRASNAQRLDESGSGLGLFLAKSIIRLSGGDIGFTSEEAAGSTFWFILPKQGSPARSGEIGFEKSVPVSSHYSNV